MILLFLLLTSVTAFAEKVINIELNRPDKSKIISRLTIPDEKKEFPLVLFLQSAGCDSVIKDPFHLHEDLAKKNYGHLVVEKPGHFPGMKPEDCRKDDVLLKDDVFSRAEDAFHVLEFIKKNTKWNGNYLIIGVSEGTVVGTLLSKKKTPKAMALLAGANGLTLEEMWNLLIEQKKLPCGFTSKKELKKAIDDIYKKSNSKESFCSDSVYPKSYYYWSRVLRLSLMEYFTSFDFPIYVAHGTADKIIPIEASIEVEKAFERLEKKNLYLKRYHGLDHFWTDENGKRNARKVMSDLFKWLSQF